MAQIGGLGVIAVALLLGAASWAVRAAERPAVAPSSSRPEPLPAPPPAAPDAPVHPPSSPGWGSARHVVILSEDGLSPMALRAADAPSLKALVREGASSMAAQTIRTACTLPSHAAMLTGVDVQRHGLGWNRWRPERGYVRVPTIFSAATGQGLTAAAFVGKPKLKHLAPPGSVALFSRPGYLCRKVVDQAARYLREARPALTFVHFSDPDEAGHALGWDSPAQLRAIHHADRCLGQLLSALDEADMRASTLIIVSSDHGGHGHGHGTRASDRLIPWVAVGPGVRAGYEIRGPVQTFDTAATALHALGVPAPAEIEGRALAEIFGGG